MNRREFLESSTAAAAGIAVSGWPHPLAAQMPAKPIGIQVGAVSFLDEGTDKVLDTLAEIGAVDTLFLATFTYGRGIGGRQPRGSPLPDHGKQEYDDDYHGGNFATPHPQYYRGTQHRPAEGARSSELRRHRRRAAACAQARHESDLLVRGRLPERTFPVSTRPSRSTFTASRRPASATAIPTR